MTTSPIDSLTMKRAHHRHAAGWLRLASALGTLLSIPIMSGCPGNLDPGIVDGSQGGSSGGGAGGNPQGGTSGTGGTSPTNCTGNNDGATLITATCATTYCHDSTTQYAGLNLTIDANVGSRLVGVLSKGINGSLCANWPTPYLEPKINPAAGLLIDKITMSSGTALCPGGSSMPYLMPLLSSTQQACIEQWAEGLVMAAP